MVNANDSLAQLISQHPRDARVCHDTSAKHLEEKRMQEALNFALKAVDLGLQAKRPNLWHIRNCARILIDVNLPGLALDLIDRNRNHDGEGVLTLQRARALRSLRRDSEAITALELTERQTRDEVYRRQLRNYRMDLLKA